MLPHSTFLRLCKLLLFWPLTTADQAQDERKKLLKLVTLELASE